LGFCCRFFLLLIVFTALQILALRFINPPFTLHTGWRWIHCKARGKPFYRPFQDWRNLEDISPELVKAVLAGEDQRFFRHHGFDFIEIDQALRELLRAKRIRGASTISMQVARTVFLWPDRNWLRKVAEAYYTVMIETLWDKKRILEVYLNTVDWGAGIVGAEAAARKYFEKTSDRITPREAALLAAILPSPHRWSPIDPTEAVRLRQERIMRDMHKMHLPESPGFSE
jgi:monofunctional biosynthetic peptidoglycan transglycosylase